MSDDLLKAAKAVCDDAERGTKNIVTLSGELQSMIDTRLVATLRAAVSAAGGVVEAVSIGRFNEVHNALAALVAVIQFKGVPSGTDLVRGPFDAALNALRGNTTPLADGCVSVPVETLRRMRELAHEHGTAAEASRARAEFLSLLDPLLPAAPKEPPKELTDRWEPLL